MYSSETGLGIWYRYQGYLQVKPTQHCIIHLLGALHWLIQLAVLAQYLLRAPAPRYFHCGGKGVGFMHRQNVQILQY